MRIVCQALRIDRNRRMLPALKFAIAGVKARAREAQFEVILAQVSHHRLF